ncbi:hypothetical protein GLOTRDRAFT_130449 [Gloeophyllum trabeum ATCC 11539]|uniref:Uncharacterized protein n=1 Tax=Gloeophyllum trabeum (strain ATCC 11539 / FP-39264 / Madison 617) TaxID=670483 RepID=S7RID5_GLOTA|nr:uncharacterized protein GLOTRDRAFT_130449 [Gloeophyllum trabeum ATCC 11539]EPQ54065.1 hypothetical protein GLOTRDRAFT_130449 [Gloeophyllum trabeum ATCC 11539]
MSVAEGATAAAIAEGTPIDGAEINSLAGDKHKDGALDAAEKEALKNDVLLVDVPGKRADEAPALEINGGEHANGANAVWVEAV